MILITNSKVTVGLASWGKNVGSVWEGPGGGSPHHLADISNYNLQSAHNSVTQSCCVKTSCVVRD